MTSTPEVIPEFGIKRENEERRDGGCGIVFDPASQRYAVGKQTNSGLLRLFSGGVDEHEDIQTGVLREVTEESGLANFLYVEKIGKALTHYHNTLKNINRLGYATCFLIILQNTNLIETQLEAHEQFTLVWATAEEIVADWRSRNENKDYDHWIHFFSKAVKRAVELGYDTTSVIV